MAKRKRPMKKGKGFGIEKMADDIRDAAINALRNAAKEVVNDLASISPNWSGEFRQDWYVATKDGKRGAQARGEDGKYTLWNIPQLKAQGRNAKGQFTAAKPTYTGKIELFINNASPYARVAMDLEPYQYPNLAEGETLPSPKGSIVSHGYRPTGGMRGQIYEPGFGDDANPPNHSTAPLDWYSTYMEGGAFTTAFNKGAKAGFLVPTNRPRFN